MNVPMFWHVEIKKHFWTDIPEISNDGDDYRCDRRYR